MQRRTRALLAAGAAGLYGILWGALAAWDALTPRSNPHAFMAEPGRCVSCHLEARPERRPYQQMNFRQDIVSLCTGCHDPAVSHPVDVAPGRVKGIALPLDPDGTMTCVSCHAPHGAPFSSVMHTGRTVAQKVADTAFPFQPSRFRTYFLRIPSPRGELCRTCHDRPISSPPPAVALPPRTSYAGSLSCAVCHPAEYRLWLHSPHARMLRSPRRHPEALVADFSASPPFSPSEIAYVLGSRTVQRFVSVRGESLVVRHPIWLVRPGEWNLSYWREPDWLTQCAGCHTTALDPFRGGWLEDGIACEACHGPGKAHASTGGRERIVNPAKLPPARAEMICEACHTAGHDRTGQFRYPLGFLPGEDLGEHFFGLTPKPGQDDASFRGDGSAMDRHAQYRFWKSRMLVAEGATCDLCKNFRLSARESSRAGEGVRLLSPEEYCRSCHDGTLLPPPRFHEGGDVAGKPCLPCHPPARNRAGSPSVHDHRYLPPGATGETPFPTSSDSRSICFRCHSKGDVPTP